MVFRDAGVCYAIMPAHVAGGSRSVTVYSAAPVVHSSATIETPFWSGMDLAIGVARGSIEKRCTAKLADLNNQLQPETGARLQLLRLRPSGEPERIDMVVTQSEYLTLNAQISDGKSELFKGTSGAFLFDNDKPVGMVIKALSATEGQFIRIEEIYQNVSRRISRRAGYAQTTVQAVEAAPDALAIPLEFVEATLPPIAPEVSEENMQGSGSYVFRLTKPNRITFKVIEGEAVTLSGLRITSALDGVAGLPRDIQIDVSSAPDGARIRPLYAGQMPPDGNLDIKLAGTRVRWVYVTIRSGWDRAEIGLDDVVFY